MNVPAFVRRSAPKNRNARDAEIAEVRRRAGCSDFTAPRRLNAFAAGTIDEAALYAPIVRTPKREIEQALPCPVTGGCPTRMTAGAFTAHCEARRGAFVGDEYANVVFRRRCDDCKGEPDNWPDELSVLEPAAPPVQDNEEKKEKQEDQAMANKPANCELCGQKAALKTSHNFNVCPTCVKVMQYTGNHADKIATAAKLLGKDVELARGLGLETGSDSTPSESAAVELASLRAAAALARTHLNQHIPVADRENLDDTQCYEDVAEKAAAVCERLTSANAERHALRQILQPDEPRETLLKAAERAIKSGKAWDALMESCKDSGFGEFADARPEVLVRQFMQAATEPARALDELRAKAAELLDCPRDGIVQALRLVQTTMESIREVVEPEVEGEDFDSLPGACRALVARYHAARDAEHDASEDEATAAENEAIADAARQAFGADLGADDLAHTIMGLSERLRERETEIEWLRREPAKPGKDPMDEALLRWAVNKYNQGKIKLQVEVREEDAA